MVITVIAIALGVFFGSAAIIIPRVVNRRNDPADESDSRAYLAATGRSAQDVERGNDGQPSRPGNEAGSRPPGE